MSVQCPEDESFFVTIDDDPVVNEIIEVALGMPSLYFKDLSTLTEQAPSLCPYAAFVDVHLKEDEDGLEVLPFLSKTWTKTPLIVITADSDKALITRALNLGADDFIRKPLDINELTARTHVRRQDVMRRFETDHISIGDLVLNKVTRMLVGPNGKEFLSPMATHLLAYLSRSTGITVGKDAVKTYLWQETTVTENAINKRISEIKKQIQSCSAQVTLDVKYGEGIALNIN